MIANSSFTVVCNKAVANFVLYSWKILQGKIFNEIFEVEALSLMFIILKLNFKDFNLSLRIVQNPQ